MEVILGKQHEVRCGADTVVEEVDDVNYENDRQSCTVSPRIPLAAQTLAQSIHELEIKGKEVVVLPMRYKLSMCLGAIMPWRLG